MNLDSIRSRVEEYYNEKIQIHGPTPQGVDWNSRESQQMRFAQLLKIVDRNQSFTINDFGCGYGALADHLALQAMSFRYCGFDISAEMISRAEEIHRAAADKISFVNQQSDVPRADYTIASGIFNVRLDTPTADWEAYIFETLVLLDQLSKKGFAFNVLTKYSDPQFMRPDLYYADPLFLFDYCKTNFSRYVALLHDYPLYEFTIIVRKDSSLA